MAPTDINHLAGLALLKTKGRLMVHVLVVCQAYAEVCHCFFNIFFFFFYLRRKEMNKTKSYLVINLLNLREREILFKNKTTKMKLQNSSTRRCFGSRYQMSPTRKALPSESTAPQWTRAAHRTFNYQTVHIYSDKNISPSETDRIQLLY